MTSVKGACSPVKWWYLVLVACNNFFFPLEGYYSAKGVAQIKKKRGSFFVSQADAEILDETRGEKKYSKRVI